MTNILNSSIMCQLYTQLVFVKLLTNSKQLVDKKSLQHTSSILVTLSRIVSFFDLFVRSAQGGCETRSFSFISRRKHLLEREGSLKISTSSRIGISVTCADQCSQRFCERRCLLNSSRQLVSLAVCCHPLLIGCGFSLATDAECFSHVLRFQSRLLIYADTARGEAECCITS